MLKFRDVLLGARNKKALSEVANSPETHLPLQDTQQKIMQDKSFFFINLDRIQTYGPYESESIKHDSAVISDKTQRYKFEKFWTC